MPLSRLDPVTALIVIDLQHGIVGMADRAAATAVVERAVMLARSFRDLGLPRVFSSVVGAAPGRVEQARNLADRAADWAELLPELEAQADDHLIQKKTWGAFTAIGLDAWLRQRNATQVVVAGIATSIGVESTARQAHELGYNVTLAIDAMTDANPDAHYNSVARIFPRLGETGSAQTIIEMLERDRR